MVQVCTARGAALLREECTGWTLEGRRLGRHVAEAPGEGSDVQEN